MPQLEANIGDQRHSPAGFLLRARVAVPMLSTDRCLLVLGNTVEDGLHLDRRRINHRTGPPA
jgi:hypothetical protein